MVEDGNKVTFLTYGDKEDYLYTGQLGGIEVIPVYANFKKSKYKVINLIVSLFIPFIFKEKFKSAGFFKTNQMFGAWVPVMAAFFLKKPLIVRCGFEMLRNMLRDEKNKIIWILKAVLGYILEIISYTYAEKIIISNNSDLNYIHKKFPVKKKKIRLIRNFIDVDCFSPDVNTYQNITDQKTILFIGRLDNRKNIKNLLKAVGIAGCSITIVGTGNLKEYFKQQAYKYGCTAYFLNMVNNRKIPEIIQTHDIFILPSFYENNPKTLLEAMACGRICIGTNVDGIRELIKNGLTGYLCETDPASIAFTIRKVIKTESDILTQIAKVARRFVINECSIENVYKKEIKLYR